MVVVIRFITKIAAQHIADWYTQDSLLVIQDFILFVALKEGKRCRKVLIID